MTAFWLKCYNNISWFCVFLWVQNNKIPCTSLTRPYSPVFKIYSESDLLLPLPLLLLWFVEKAHRLLIFILGYCHNLLTVGCCFHLCLPSEPACQQELPKCRSVHVTPRPHSGSAPQTLLDPLLSSSSTTSPLCSAIEEENGSPGRGFP